MNDMWLTRGNNTNFDLNTFTIDSQHVITIMYEETKKHNLFPAVVFDVGTCRIKASVCKVHSIDGVMVSVHSSSVVDRGLKPRSGKNNHYTIWYLLLLH